MALSTVKGISITGACSVVPKTTIDNQSLAPYFDNNELSKILSSTGIRRRRVMSEQQTPLSLGLLASKKLLSELQIDNNDIGLVIVVTQTPDMPFPGNAVQLQHHLGLNKEVVAFDINLGCSGFVYGLWQASVLLNTLESSKALLIVGDATSKQYSSGNKNVNTLFGDAVSAIMLEKSDASKNMYFDFGSDGAGAPYLVQGNNGLNKPNTPAELTMDGMQVFAFTLREIPKSIKNLLEKCQLSVNDLDKVIMHQANTMMLNHLADKLAIPKHKLVISLAEYGNTSSASIPLALTTTHSMSNIEDLQRVLISGFGVGWSWGSALINFSTLQYCENIEA